jgi:hypothetical protein
MLVAVLQPEGKRMLIAIVAVAFVLIVLGIAASSFTE